MKKSNVFFDLMIGTNKRRLEFELFDDVVPKTA